MMEKVSIYCANGANLAYEEDVNVNWWFKELLICYKFGEKLRFKRALDKLRPYMDDKLLSYFEEIESQSLWLNPITGKKGY